MKKSSVAVASVIALFSVSYAFLSAGAVRIDPLTGGVKYASLIWPLMLAAVAGLTVVALLADFVRLAALGSFTILLLSFVSFFSVGLLVLVPAAILVILIALYSRRMPLSRV